MPTKRTFGKRILWSVAILVMILVAGFFYVYINLNRLLTNALNNGFNNNLISDVYELKFENLEVNILAGNVNVKNVRMHPQDQPVRTYPYINSSYRMEAKKMILKNVDLIKLLRFNKLSLKKIELVEPGIDFAIADSVPVFFLSSQLKRTPLHNKTKSQLKLISLKNSAWWMPSFMLSTKPDSGNSIFRKSIYRSRIF